jgi:hypothetical protein
MKMRDGQVANLSYKAIFKVVHLSAVSARSAVQYDRHFRQY